MIVELVSGQFFYRRDVDISRISHMKLSRAQAKVLKALITGNTLKSHRYLDGDKIYKLHPLEGQPEVIDRKIVDFLKQRRLIDSNQKFPAATYLLTQRGRDVALSLTQTVSLPPSARTKID